jgi:LacI family transcriptional regulator
MSNMIYHEMLAGFRGALAEEDIPVNKNWMIPIQFREPAHPGSKALRDLLTSPDRPTAFFAMRDYRAEQLYRLAEELHLSIPGDISVIGYDNISWQGAEAHRLTTIRQPALEIGRSAVELLSQWCVENKPPQSRIIPGEILERGSIAPPGQNI